MGLKIAGATARSTRRKKTTSVNPRTLVDFTVDVPTGRDPIVLQLTDTQIMDGAQTRPTQSQGDIETFKTEYAYKYCFDYITEIVEEIKPDLIIMTGDIVYGKYDDDGSMLKRLTDFMDGFEIPWAPVFGNHDQEATVGVDWQCEQFENAEYCLFKQRDLTGNGNYTVGLVQGDRLIRVFYMLDSNGCCDASEASLANGHTSRIVGFGRDQTEWYEKSLKSLTTDSPDTKISFAFHIQPKVFGDALSKYGFFQSAPRLDIYIDYESDRADGDFGYVGRPMKSQWDNDAAVYGKIKAWGVDSFFVGHEHCNSASVIYDGVRLQYGQKSSEYDRINGVTADGSINPKFIFRPDDATPMVGGSVIVLAQNDGTIKDAYIYYCKNAGGNIDWDALKGKS